MHRPRNTLSDRFQSWWRTLDHDRAVSKGVGIPHFRAITRSERPFMARITSPYGQRISPTIEVYRPFLREIDLDVTRNAKALATASLFSPPSVLDNPQTRHLLIAGTRELAESFLLLHELFHICCGHLGWSAAHSPQTRHAYDELTLGMSDDQHRSRQPKRSHNAAMNAARYREVEADNSALQWLIRSPLPSSWQQLCQHRLGKGSYLKAPILELEGDARRMAFAAVMNAVWLMTAALERGRQTARTLASDRPGGAAKWQRGTSHPYPMARLLASTFTLLEQYAELTSVKMDAAGFRSQRLSGKQATASRSFVTEILRYSLTTGWVAPTAVPTQWAAGLHPPSIVREFANLLTGKPTRTPAGKQLEMLQALRKAQAAAYAPYRCLPTERS